MGTDIVDVSMGGGRGGLGTDMGLFNVHIMRCGGVLGQTLGMLIM